METQNKSSVTAEQMAFFLHENQDEEVDLVELFYLLWGHLLQIIACIIVGGIVGFGCTFFLMTPMYKATAKMYVVSSSNNSIVNLNDLALGTQLAVDYQELILSRSLLEDVIQELALNTTFEDLIQQVSIVNPGDTRILEISVTCPNPELAADIANEIAEQAVVYLPRIMESPAPNIYESAIVPTQKASPSYSLNTMIGAVVLSVVYSGVLIVRYLMDDTLTTPEDINRVFGVQPLAFVPEGNLKKAKHKHGRTSAR